MTRSDGATTLCLEGELKLPWLDTLEFEVDRRLRRGSRVVLDFQDVTLVSLHSIDTLRRLVARGVAIENATDWVRSLLPIGEAP